MIFKKSFLSVFLFALFLLGELQLSYADMIDYPEIKIQALNKSTARTVTLNGKVGQTIEYGSLFIKVQSCRKSEPLDKPENAAFLQIWEVPIGKKKSEWAFSGWMFSSSPAVSAMDHAVYDVWVLECFDSNAAKEEPINKVIVNDIEFDENAEEILETPSDIVNDQDIYTQIILMGDDEDAVIEDNSNSTTSEIINPTEDTVIIEAEPFANETDSDGEESNSFDALINGVSNEP